VIFTAPPTPLPGDQNPFAGPRALIFDSVQSRLLSVTVARIYSFPLVGGVLAGTPAPIDTFAGGFSDVALDPRRDQVVVSDPCGRVLVKANGGILGPYPLLAEPAAPCGSLIRTSALALAPEQDAAFVYERYYGEIHSVDLATGTTTPLRGRCAIGPVLSGLGATTGRSTMLRATCCGPSTCSQHARGDRADQRRRVVIALNVWDTV
jgi:hypothetical protein